MKILVIGAGGREHTLLWKLSQSPLVSRLYCAPGNGGTAKIAKTVPVKEHEIEALAEYAEKEKIDLTVVGPEAPLVLGVADVFRKRGLMLFGPSQKASVLEGSKIFTKNFFSKNNIPTPAYHTFFTMDDALYHIRTTSLYPMVIKADGLAAGKGVFIAHNEEDAVSSIKEMMELKKFKEAGEKIIIEEFIEGNELSYQLIVKNGKVIELKPSQDFKKAYDNDKGPNTGGMGNMCPPSWMNPDILQMVKENIAYRLVDNLSLAGIQFNGVLFIGLMLTQQGPKALEINVRFGDPEIQSVFPLMRTDFIEILEAYFENQLDEIPIIWENKCSCCVVVASKGYPGSCMDLGHEIIGLDMAGKMKDVMIFHAGTKKVDGKIINSGGRVLNVVGFGKTSEEASKKAYEAVEKISFPGMHYRKDIK